MIEIMGDKYTNLIGRFHLAKEAVKEKWSSTKEEGGIAHDIGKKADDVREKVICKINHGENNYEHLYRRKNRWELTRISAAVMGIEFAYAAETAFVSPTLLKIGVLHEHMTLIWCLSPLIGFFLTPILGSLSDRCKSNLGRRRPFIVLLSIGVVLGLILVPNGKLIGKKLGDQYPREDELERHLKGPGGRRAALFNNSTITELDSEESPEHHSHPWGVFFTVIGTVLLDFDADACQSPSRAYLLDVTLPEDHAIGLSTFTVMAGLGGSLGYAMGAFNWGSLADLFGGHVRLVFTLVLGIFVACVIVTLTSFSEIPLSILAASQAFGKTRRKSTPYSQFVAEEGGGSGGNEFEKLDPKSNYGSFQESHPEEKQKSGNPFVKTKEHGGGSGAEEKYLQVAETSFSQASPMPVEEGELTADASVATLTNYLWTIIYMPNSLRVLCLTNLFCWMSLVCYSLYFTDFVGEAVFRGNPSSPPGSKERQLYDEGVQFGCWGMALYSLSCSIYSFTIEKLVKKFRARPVYAGGQLVYSIGMVFMALARSKLGVIVFSCSAGIMYSTLFTMPYLIVAHYHETDTYSEEDRTKSSQEKADAGLIRGIGTDVGIVSSMVFLAQFILSLSMGSIISAAGTTTAVIVAASVLSFCGSCSALFVTYLDL